MTGEPHGFTCPVCGAHRDRDISFSFDTEMVEKREVAEMWPGGPLVTVPTLFKTMEPGRRTFSTDVCGHVFDLSEWSMSYNTVEATGREWYVLKPRGAS